MKEAQQPQRPEESAIREESPPKTSILAALRESLFSRIASSAIAITAAASACGGKPPPPETPVCEQPANKEQMPPRLSIDNLRSVEGQIIRVHFTVPEFNKQCMRNLTVHVMATAITHAQRGKSAVARTISLGTKNISGPGTDSIDVVIPAEYSGISSIWLEASDARGQFTTGPTKPIL